MKIKQKITYIVAIFGIVAIGAMTVAPSALAAGPQKKCGDANTSIIGCKGVDDNKAETSAVWKLLLIGLNIMTAGIGILAVGGIAYGAVLYTTASSKPEQVKKAMTIITNVVIGIVAYGMMFLVLNFLVPGGIFTASVSPSSATTIAASIEPSKFTNLASVDVSKVRPFNTKSDKGL